MSMHIQVGQVYCVNMNPNLRWYLIVKQQIDDTWFRCMYGVHVGEDSHKGKLIRVRMIETDSERLQAVNAVLVEDIEMQKMITLMFL